MAVTGKLPRFAGETGLLFKRDYFLNGAYMTYYMSGQTPDGVTGDTARGGYQKPMDWNSAGSLLRPPQMVCLAAQIAIDQNPVINENFYQDWLTQYVVISDGSTTNWADGAGFTSTGDYSTIPATVTSSGNKGQAKPFVRINQAFQDAQTTIQAIRKGRTWVDVINYYNYESIFAQGVNVSGQQIPWAPQYFTGPYYFASPNNITPIPGYSYSATLPYYTKVELPNNAYTTSLATPGGSLPWILTPQLTDKFFGTDFLHVFCSGGVIRGPVDAFDMPTGEPPQYLKTSDPYYLAAKARMAACYPKFAGYAAYLYNVGTEGDMPGGYISSGSTSAGPDFPSTSTNYSTGNINTKPCNVSNQLLGGWFQTIANDLGGYGYSYNGTSEQLTSSNIVKLIASHYNFDSATGKDL